VVGFALATATATILGCGGQAADSTSGTSAVPSTTSGAQALRVCADRWNQGNMLGWGPTLAHVSAKPQCTVFLAVHYARDPHAGCSGNDTMPGYRNVCVARKTTFRCAINRFGGFECPTNADTARTPLTNQNAVADVHGTLKLSISLSGTHATAPLDWQRRYPHVDGWILPWTSDGKLRPGLELKGSTRAVCSRGSQAAATSPAIRCRVGAGITDPCFAKKAVLAHGVIAACPNAAGSTAFARFVIR
jgi:hypothetical protein